MPSAGRASGSVVAAVAAVAVLLAAAAVAIAIHGGQPDTAWLATRNALSILAPVGVGLYAWREATHDRFGRLLVAAGMLWFLVALAASGDPVVYSIGRVGGWISEIAIAYLVLAFPAGRLPARADRLLVGGVVALIAVLYVPTALLVEWFPVPVQYTTCVATCPANAFALVDATPGWVADVVIPLRETIAILLTVLVAGRLGYRLWAATPLMRRALAPALVIACLRLATLGVMILVRRLELVDQATLSWLVGILAVTLPLLSLAFLVGLVGWRLYTADALLLLAWRLRGARGPEERRAAIVEAVKDPSLDVAYARDRRWVSADGWPVQLPGPRAPRTATIIEDDGRPVAALLHDPALAEQRPFIEAVGSYALVWDENERLTASVSSWRDEVRASHARIIAAADDERRRIERDLHDGGQQRLVALRIRLQLAEETLAGIPADAREMLHRLVDDTDAALEELRALAAGVFPASLAAHGLPDAVRAAARETPLPVQVSVQGSGRYTPETETAIYFCCLEALQNVVKHAAGATHAEVRLELDTGLRFEVSDDGAGFDPVHTPTHGLLNMRDRLEALGGALEIDTAPGEGTRIRGRLPGDGVGVPEPAEGGGSEVLLADEPRGA